MIRLSTDEARFIRRWLSIEEDTERDILLRAMKPKEDWSFLKWVFLAMVFVMIANYLGLEAWGEKWLR